MTLEEFQSLQESWALHLRAERKSAQTVKTYTDGLRRFTVWCRRDGHGP